MKIEVSFSVVLCFLLVAEVFATLDRPKRRKDDPEVASAIVPEISVKKINQVVITRYSVLQRDCVPVSEELIHYPPVLELSFKKYIYKLIRIITMENFSSEHFNILENNIDLKNFRTFFNN